MRRKLALERREKRVCECGGDLDFLHVGGDFLPRTRCRRCGALHIGLEGTKKEEKCTTQ
jgi:hypothetical protein